MYVLIESHGYTANEIFKTKNKILFSSNNYCATNAYHWSNIRNEIIQHINIGDIEQYMKTYFNNIVEQNDNTIDVNIEFDNDDSILTIIYEKIEKEIKIKIYLENYNELLSEFIIIATSIKMLFNNSKSNLNTDFKKAIFEHKIGTINYDQNKNAYLKKMFNLINTNINESLKYYYDIICNEILNASHKSLLIKNSLNKKIIKLSLFNQIFNDEITIIINSCRIDINPNAYEDLLKNEIIYNKISKLINKLKSNKQCVKKNIKNIINEKIQIIKTIISQNDINDNDIIININIFLHIINAIYNYIIFAYLNNNIFYHDMHLILCKEEFNEIRNIILHIILKYILKCIYFIFKKKIILSTDKNNDNNNNNKYFIMLFPNVTNLIIDKCFTLDNIINSIEQIKIKNEFLFKKL
jgi:hypothetical protein